MKVIRGSRRPRAVVVALVSAVVLFTSTAAQGATSFKVSAIPVPGNPVTLAVDNGAHRGYAALGDQPAVAVFSTRNKKALGTIPVGRVTALAVDPHQHRLYAAQDDRTLAVIDTRSRAVVQRLDIGVLAFRLVVDPGTLKVLALSADPVVTVIQPDIPVDPTTTIPLPGSPTGITIESARHRAYLAQSTGVTVVDTATDTALGTARLDATPFDVAFDESTRRLFVVSREDQVIRVVDTTNGTQVASFTDPDPTPGAIAIDPDSHLGYVTHPSFPSPGTVTVFDTTSYAVLARVSVGRISQIAVDATTHKAFLPSFRTFSIAVITPRA